MVKQTHIVAKGAIGGRFGTIEVLGTDGDLTVTTNEPQWGQRFNQMVNQPPPLGGTYYPRPRSLLAAVSVLQRGFFDSPPGEVTVEGPLEAIPYEGGVIY